MILCRVPTRSVKGKSPPLANQATAHGRPWAPRSLAANRQTVRASTGGEEEEEEEEEEKEERRRREERGSRSLAASRPGQPPARASGSGDISGQASGYPQC
ncbi:unnamed protein product [Prorocentrum cordatum]|uniref:Uncharacterized protein n=1 Tax=Prorocentrum cordatum TaxID=2364126 RepID=A0ABN9UPS7_9DINO|nr:unnamed protein product [Polarella glacialis]